MEQGRIENEEAKKLGLTYLSNVDKSFVLLKC